MYAPPQVQIGLEASPQKCVNYFLRVASPAPCPTDPEQSNVSEVQKNQKVGPRPGDAPFFGGSQNENRPWDVLWPPNKSSIGKWYLAPKLIFPLHLASFLEFSTCPNSPPTPGEKPSSWEKGWRMGSMAHSGPDLYLTTQVLKDLVE